MPITPLTAFTPGYSLPYPVGTDTPTGATQIQDLAQAIDTGLTKNKTQTNPPWVQLDWLDNQTIAAGATPYTNFALTTQSAHNAFSLIDPQNIATNRTGNYYIYWDMRLLRTAGTPAVGGFITITMQSPIGVTTFDAARPSFQASWVDIPGNALVTMSNGQGLLFQINNQSGATYTIKGGRIWISWMAT